MKFWKLTLLSALAFFAISTIVLHSACTVDNCSDVKCLNGGACIDGFCNCPSGYEGANCSQQSYTRFTGKYAGNTGCDLTPSIFDTAIIYLESLPLNMGVVLLSHKNDTLWRNDTLHGTINGSNIVVADYYAPRFSRHIVVTLDNSKLNIFDQEVHLQGNNVVDTNKSICNFYGQRLSQ